MIADVDSYEVRWSVKDARLEALGPDGWFPVDKAAAAHVEALEKRLTDLEALSAERWRMFQGYVVKMREYRQIINASLTNLERM